MRRRTLTTYLAGYDAFLETVGRAPTSRCARCGEERQEHPVRAGFHRCPSPEAYSATVDIDTLPIFQEP